MLFDFSLLLNIELQHPILVYVDAGTSLVGVYLFLFQEHLAMRTWTVEDTFIVNVFHVPLPLYNFIIWYQFLYFNILWSILTQLWKVRLWIVVLLILTKIYRCFLYLYGFIWCYHLSSFYLHHFVVNLEKATFRLLRFRVLGLNFQQIRIIII